MTNLFRFPFLFLFLFCLTTSSCKNDDPSLRECMVGEWTVDVVNIEGQNVAPSNMEFDFEDDGDFDLEFVFAGTRYTMAGEWEVNESSKEIELNYDDREFFDVGLGGFFLEKDILKEEYDIDKDSSDDIDLDATVEGLDIRLKMERD